MHIFLARVIRQEPVEGIRSIHLELVQDKETLELHDGDEFVTVQLAVDPFEGA